MPHIHNSLLLQACIRLFFLPGTSSDTLLTTADFCKAVRKCSSLTYAEESRPGALLYSGTSFRHNKLRWPCVFLPTWDVPIDESLQTAIALEQSMKEKILLQLLAVQSSQQSVEECKNHVA